MRLLEDRIRGAGGGGGAYEQTDTLRSTQIADLLDLISEGECEGLVDGLKSIYLDGVPLKAADGSMNFDGVTVATTSGTQGQASIAGTDGVQNEIAVGVTVLFATPIVRSITDSGVDTCRVTIVVPQLSSSNPDNGDLVGSTVEWSIEVQSAGGGYVEVFREEIAGKTMSSYPRAVSFKLPGAAPWDVKVKRLTADSGTATLVNAFGWSSYAEIQSLKLRYPNSCMVRTRVDAKQFSRIPVRMFDWLGMRIQVPTNYDPLTRVYTGVWDGTFKIAWTDCAAWIYHDIVKHNRYGLGRYIATTDAFKWEMYSIGRYCDEMVPDGYGGTEPRFRCSPQLETREQAYKVLADMAAIFMGMAYWSNSDVTVVQDAPADSSITYTPANVEPSAPGKYFNYAGASNARRYSQVVVWFNNLPDRGKLVPEVVVDQDLVALIGVKTLELSPMGIWSRGQAQRIGKWALYTQEMQRAAVAFNVGMDGVLVPPGKVFQIADPAEAGERLAGRVHAATTTVVTLDADVVLASGETYLLTVMLQDPADPAKLVTQQRAVSTGAGTTRTITVAAAFTAAPVAETVWLLQSEAVEATWWRSVGLAENSGTNTYTISAIAHAPQKYALIEQGIAFEAPSISRIKVEVPKPLDVLLTETPYRSGSITRSRVTVSWRAPTTGLTFVLSWRLNNGPWTHVPSTSANTVEMDGLATGVMDVVVNSRNALGNNSPTVQAGLLLVGKTTPAPNVVGFTATVVQGGVRFTWTPSSSDTYLKNTLKIGATVLFEGATSSWTWPWPALGTYTVTAIEWDTSLNPSAAPASVTVTVDASVLLQWASITGPGKPPDTLNYDFTQGTDGWTGLTSVSADASASGGYSATLSGVAGGYSDRALSVDTDRVYRVRGRLKRTSGAGGTVFIGVTCRDASGAVISNSLGGTHPYAAAAGVTLAADSTWHTFEGLISGVQAPFPSAVPDYHKFWPGTVRAAPFVFTLSGWTGDLQVDYASIDDVTDAVNAQLLASAAQASADGAIAKLTEIASDSLLTPDEKPAVMLDYTAINNEYAGIFAQATAFGITTEKTAWDVAVSAFVAYMATLTAPTLWSNVAGNTTIVGATFRAKFADVYATRQVLLNKIAEVAGTKASWSGVSGAGKPEDYANHGAVGGYVNTDPLLQYPAEWTFAGSSGANPSYYLNFAAGNGLQTAWDKSDGGSREIYSARFPISPFKTYLIESSLYMWAANTATHYLGCFFYDVFGNLLTGWAYPTGWPAVGTGHYYGLFGTSQVAGGSRYSLSFGALATAKIPAAAVSMRVAILGCYNNTADRWSWGGAQVREMAETSTVANGAITTPLIATDAATEVAYVVDPSGSSGTFCYYPFSVAQACKATVYFEIDWVADATAEAVSRKIRCLASTGIQIHFSSGGGAPTALGPNSGSFVNESIVPGAVTQRKEQLSAAFLLVPGVNYTASGYQSDHTSATIFTAASNGRLKLEIIKR